MDKDKQIIIDGVDINVDEFYNMLESVDEVPSTAAPSIGEISNRVNEWKTEGYLRMYWQLSVLSVTLNCAEQMFAGIS